jgi:hypothetical protein
VLCFTKLKEFNLKPKKIVIDFEIALKNSLECIFSESRIFECAFHYGQNLWRQIQKFGLTNFYKNDKRVKQLLRMYFDLIFVPIEKIGVALEHITEYADSIQNIKNSKFEQFNMHYKNNYTGHFENYIFKLPRYSPTFWNCYERIVEKAPRTINIAEAWHRTFRESVEYPHPNLAKFILCLQREEEKTRTRLLRWENGTVELPRSDLEQEEKLFIISTNFELY